MCAELQPAERLTGRSAPPRRAPAAAGRFKRGEGGGQPKRGGELDRTHSRPGLPATDAERRGRAARAWIEPQVRVGRRRVGRARARTHGRIREGCRAKYVRARGRGRARAGADAGGERPAGTGRGGRGGTGGRWGGEKGKWQSARGGARGESCARRRGARRGQPRPCGAWSHGPTRWCVCAPPAAVRRAARRGGAEWAVVVAWGGGASGLRRARGGIGPLCVNPAMRLPLTAAAVTRRATRALRRPSPLLRAAA